MDSLILKIFRKIEKEPFDSQAYKDFAILAEKQLKHGYDETELVSMLKELSQKLENALPRAAKKDVNIARSLMEGHKEVLRLLARYDFESYMLFCEFEREPDKKFYKPRQKQLRPVVESLQALADDNLDLLAISLPPGVGKLLADDTPIFTRKGWKKHGDLQVGDEVIGLDGKFKRVGYVFPKDVANYEVTFTNGEKIKCHGNHEWYVYNRHNHKWGICSTESMLKQGVSNGGKCERGHRYAFQLPLIEPMEGREQELPVDPYVFGAWLGDGTADKPALTICNTDGRIVYEVVKHYYPLRRVYNQAGCKRYEFKGLREDLQKINLCASHERLTKYIPEIYLRASLKQRLKLLAGLIDTDGTKSREGRYSISTANERLRDGICDLISSFGWRYTIVCNPACTSSSGIVGKHDVYNILFNPTLVIPCKIARKQLHVAAQKRRISICDIRPIPPVSGNCIQVEGGYYRAGRTMLPTHNSTLAIFYLTWMAGKFPDEPMLTGSHSNAWIRGAYDECLRIMDPEGEYLWRDAFPGVSVTSTNAKDCRIDLGRRKRFETLEFTTVGTGNAGLYRAARLLYCDDLVSGLEVALSKERLDKLWETYTTDLRQRKIGDHCKELHIATRWSVHDVVGRLEEQYAGDGRAKFIALPAMDEHDESNFNYPYGLGFTTNFYREQRLIMDDVNWRALYMNQPIEREGLLYSADELQRYFELPDGEPDAIISVCDTKDRGSDDCVMPIAYVYGERYYIEDIVCDNSNPEVVDQLLIEVLLKHKVKLSCFESNSAGGRVAQTVQQGVKDRGGITKIETRYTTKNKETKILANSPWVKEHCLFKDDTVSDRGYKRAIGKLCAYSTAGKNKHDDVPDAFAQLAEYAQGFGGATVQVFKRPF